MKLMINTIIGEICHIWFSYNLFVIGKECSPLLGRAADADADADADTDADADAKVVEFLQLPIAF